MILLLYIALFPILIFNRIELLALLIIFSYIGRRALKNICHSIRKETEIMEKLNKNIENVYSTELTLIFFILLTIYTYIYHFPNSIIAGIISTIIVTSLMIIGTTIRKVLDPSPEKFLVTIGNILKIIIVLLIINFYYDENINMIKIGSFAYLLAEFVVFQGEENE